MNATATVSCSRAKHSTRQPSRPKLSNDLVVCGQQIKTARETLKLQKHELATKAGVGYQHVVDAECGLVIPYGKLKDIAKTIDYDAPETN